MEGIKTKNARQRTGILKSFQHINILSKMEKNKKPFSFNFHILIPSFQ